MSIHTYMPPTATPQTEPIPGEAQVSNSAGGFSYALDKWALFRRFLILGTEGGSYYIKEQKLTAQNLDNVKACIEEDGLRAVALIVEISDRGLAPKNTPAEVALAMAASVGLKDTDETRQKFHGTTRAAAFAALPKVCRIPTHLFHFVQVLKTQRGFGSTVRKAVGAWYARWDSEKLAYELAKYQSRDGFSNRDVLRLMRPKGQNAGAYRYAIGAGYGEREVKRKVGKTVTYGATEEPALFAAIRRAKEETDPNKIAAIVFENGLSREMLPTKALNHAVVWDALLQQMPYTAMMRNLGNMSKAGLLGPLSDSAEIVRKRLTNAELVRKSRVHPLGVLLALKTYGGGKGFRGDNAWKVSQPVVDALDAAFYLAFESLQPTGKRFLFGLDVSGSMSSSVCGTSNLTCAEGTAAMAMACARVESNYHIMGFAGDFRDLGITASMSLQEAMRRVLSQNFGTTDCSLPAQWALKNKVNVDCFVVMTDNETFGGRIHPSQAMREYRKKMSIDSRLVVVGMVGNSFTIADPKDPLSLDVVGFDASVPAVISEFVR